MTKKYDLIKDLFLDDSNKIKPEVNAESVSNNTSENNRDLLIDKKEFQKEQGNITIKADSTKRTFKIYNALWDDFIDLVAAKRSTQAEFINQLIKDAINENAELLKRFREFYNKK